MATVASQMSLGKAVKWLDSEGEKLAQEVAGYLEAADPKINAQVQLRAVLENMDALRFFIPGLDNMTCRGI